VARAGGCKARKANNPALQLGPTHFTLSSPPLRPLPLCPLPLCPRPWSWNPQNADGQMEGAEPSELPVGRLQLMEVVDMLMDIGRCRQQALGTSQHLDVSDTSFVTALALIQLEEGERAAEQLEMARVSLPETDLHRLKLVDMARIMLSAISAE
jgi:hypothetical protein